MRGFWKATLGGAALMSVAIGTATAQAGPDAPGPADWLAHVTDDLLPFWSAPGATGTPEGAFPGRLCNDGALPVSGADCPGVQRWNADGERTLVAQSRQVFSYAVAFHMTGDTRWLSLAQAGVENQFDTFLDVPTGLFAHSVDAAGAPGGVGMAEAQKQAYGLLGPTMVYYLTGDAALYDRITTVADRIERDFRRGDGFAGTTSDTMAGPRLVDTLDQLNAWQTLLAAQAPLADRPALVDRALRSARDLVHRFHDPLTGLFKTDARQPDGAVSGQSFGHAIKALWFIDQTAQLAGDAALARFAAGSAAQVFALAFDPASGGWRAGTDADGAPLAEGVWWDHAELTQYAAALAITRPELREMLTQVQRFWLDSYVDGVDGGIWPAVALADGTANTARSKHWEWKAGFHSFEHALINYLAASAMEDETATLFFARADGTPPETLAYGFSGGVTLVPGAPALFGAVPTPVQEVRIRSLTYADAALTPVPVPPAGLLLVAGLGALAWRSRARGVR